ncbi:MAG: hypothetical protein ACK559_12285, partial [bacterium]
AGHGELDRGARRIEQVRGQPKPRTRLVLRFGALGQGLRERRAFRRLRGRQRTNRKSAGRVDPCAIRLQRRLMRRQRDAGSLRARHRLRAQREGLVEPPLLPRDPP